MLEDSIMPLDSTKSTGGGTFELPVFDFAPYVAGDGRSSCNEKE